MTELPSKEVTQEFLSAETYWATLSYLCYANTQIPLPDCTVKLWKNKKWALPPKAKNPVRCNKSTLKLAKKGTNPISSCCPNSLASPFKERDVKEKSGIAVTIPLQQGRSKKMMMLSHYVCKQRLLGKDARQVTTEQEITEKNKPESMQLLELKWK